jgi:hypothetical protein
MESGYAQPWFYGMSQAFSISRNHPYTTQRGDTLTTPVVAHMEIAIFHQTPLRKG